MKIEEKSNDLRAKAKLIRSWRLRIFKTGMSQSRFCAKHGFAPALLSKWIRGNVIPRWETIERVEAALKSERN